MAAVGQSGLNSRDFSLFWRVESEATDFKVTFIGDTCDIVAPKGFTLWRQQPVKRNSWVEYDAMVVDKGGAFDRLSDMNCFWMASDPQQQSIWKRQAWRNGNFMRCYTLQMYYLGYGGNYNTTTRFRRYNGDERGVQDINYRPHILKEYSDSAHLLRPNHWYHVRVESSGDRTRFYIDGEMIVDYCDPQPLESGWFGFRTTLSHTKIANFKRGKTDDFSVSGHGIPLHWLNGTPTLPTPVTFGVPFRQGEIVDVEGLTLDNGLPASAWPLAKWPDGSVKWAAIAAVVPAQADAPRLVMRKKGGVSQEKHLSIVTTHRQVVVNTGTSLTYIPLTGKNLIDSMLIGGKRVGGAVSLTATTANTGYVSQISAVSVERNTPVSGIVRIEGFHGDGQRSWLPFVVRLYFFAGSRQVKMVHSFIYDGSTAVDMITSMGIRCRIPMRCEPYNRHVMFSVSDSTLWHEPVQPLDGRRELRLSQSPSEEGRGIPRSQHLQVEQQQCRRIPSIERFDSIGQAMLRHWAQWDGFRLSHLTDNAFSIRKRATRESPWIGTLSGHRSEGYLFLGDVDGGMALRLADFWQAYPSTIEVNDARSNEATVTMYLWSPEAEPMNLCHYDTIPHGLAESYEDVQQGMSTPYGVARTSTLWLLPQDGCPTEKQACEQMKHLTTLNQLLPTPQYLHSRRAFGVWSLPTDNKEVEKRLDEYISIYQQETERCHWYGFWNYGDVMHAYDPERNEWRYDVGGYAWDNTELASPMWLWYMFLRSGRADVWRMAEAMTRHNSEVDTYHIGPFAPLGSRHNVSHWGCGAKEARISQSAFLRFYHYLTADERMAELMHAQTDADTLLWHLDPMRLAEPRDKFPCSAPARLRIGPDWVAYVGNWMTEWERTGNAKYRNKIVAGMKSIAALPDGLFTGNKALGYRPDTGVLSYDGPAGLCNTNHLMTIMGGFEVMNELLPLQLCPEFNIVWLDHARRYRAMVEKIGRNHFPVRRLDALAAWYDSDAVRANEVWRALLQPRRGLSTNDAALWSLDAIFMLDVLQ